MTALRIGYKASAEQFGARELVEYAVLAEKHQFDTAVVSDHFQPWRHTGGHAPFAMAWLAAAGERTERITLGTSVMTPHYRYNPAVIAQAFGTLGALYPGRVMLGVGSGEALNEIATGWNGAAPKSQDPAAHHEAGPDQAVQDWPAFKERFARLRESVRLIRALWREERVSFDGEYYTTHDASIYDKPEQEVPIYIAAGGPVVAKYAGRAGDGFICTSGKGMDLYTEKLLPAVVQGAQVGRRDPQRIDRMIEIKLSYDPDPETALQNTRFWAPLSLTPEQKHSIDDPMQMEAAADALPLEQIAKRWIVGSDPAQILAAVKQYTDAGFNHLIFHGPGHDQRRFLEAFERDLAPGIRELSPATLPEAELSTTDPAAAETRDVGVAEVELIILIET